MESVLILAVVGLALVALVAIVFALAQTRAMRSWRDHAEAQDAAVDRLLIRNAELRDSCSEHAADFKRLSAAYDTLSQSIAPFDHDGDGKPGGSKPRVVK